MKKGKNRKGVVHFWLRVVPLHFRKSKLWFLSANNLIYHLNF